MSMRCFLGVDQPLQKKEYLYKVILPTISDSDMFYNGKILFSDKLTEAEQEAIGNIFQDFKVYVIYTDFQFCYAPKYKEQISESFAKNSLDELKYYESLAIAQEFTLYGCTDKEIENFRVPEDAIEMTLDDAFKMLHDPDTIIYARILGEGEVKLSKLSELSFFLRKYNGENIPFLFYWRG